MKKSIAACAIAGLAVLGAATPAMASQPVDGTHKVTFCHATHSEKNPYVVITTDKAAPVRAHVKHQDLEDVIPPFDYEVGKDSGYFGGLNWLGSASQDFIDGGCEGTVPEIPNT